jgi:hypothetical protein
MGLLAAASSSVIDKGTGHGAGRLYWESSSKKVGQYPSDHRNML